MPQSIKLRIRIITRRYCFDEHIDLKPGDPTGTRTPNRLLRRQMLYPVELWDHVVARWQRVSYAKMWPFGHTTKDGHKKRGRIGAAPFLTRTSRA